MECSNDTELPASRSVRLCPPLYQGLRESNITGKEINVRTLYQLFAPWLCCDSVWKVFIRAHEYQPRPLSCKCSKHAELSTYFVRDAGSHDYLQRPLMSLSLVPVLMILIHTAVPTYLNNNIIIIGMVKADWFRAKTGAYMNIKILIITKE